MNKITYFVAPRGEGKTQWLRERAVEETRNGNKVYMYTNSPLRYRNFIEEFYDATGEICHVLCAEDPSVVPEGSVVLIDNMISSGINTCELTDLSNKVSHIYITLEGISANNHKCNCEGKCAK